MIHVPRDHSYESPWENWDDFQVPIEPCTEQVEDMPILQSPPLLSTRERQLLSSPAVVVHLCQRPTERQITPAPTIAICEVLSLTSSAVYVMLVLPEKQKLGNHQTCELLR